MNITTKAATNSIELAVKVANVNKAFGEVQALNNVNLSVKKGQVVALLGRNGAGKSTLIKSLLGLETIDSGNITIFGQTPGSAAAKSHMGVMLQDSHPPEALTVKELYQLYASFYPAPQAISTVFAQTSLEEIENTQYGKLSGGQKRRVQLALALAGNPEVLVLDEPTAHMDSVSTKTFWSIIEEMRINGKTILLVTHHINELEAIATHISILDAGKIIANDTIAAFRQLFNQSRILCSTSLTVDILENIDSVNYVEQIGNKFALYTSSRDTTIKALLAEDSDLADIEATQPPLDSIIDRLIHASSQVESEAV